MTTTTDRHSAGEQCNAQFEDVPEDANAPARARAREHTEQSAQSEPENAVTFSDRMRSLLAQFSPPDIVNEDRPSLRKAWAYASRGAWTGEKGVLRTAGRVFGWFVLVKKTLFYELDWVTDTPARAAVSAALFVLLDQFPPLLWLFDIDKVPPLSWLI